MLNKFKEIKEVCQQRANLDQKRLSFELEQIEKLGLTENFYELYTKKKQGTENKINSLVAYGLGITLKYPGGEFEPHKKFESARVGLPDIDLDFTDRRRDEVIQYVAEKYGRDKVAQIITFGTMAARAVVRDVGRALKYSYSYCDQLAKMIPFGQSLDQTLAGVGEFRQLYLNDAQAKKLVDFAKKLEGCARHASTHACGVVISNEPLDNIVPLQHPTQDDLIIVTQYEMHSIEDLGLLKMDFLGLKNLTIIEDTLARIYKVQGKSINIENIPLDDKTTFKLFQKAETTSVFQLESDGMKRYLKELKPTDLEDIIAMVALYRPGPIQFIPKYIEGKQGKKEIEYIHPKLKPILGQTYGICVSGDSLVQTANPGSILQIDKIVSSPKKFAVQSFDFAANSFKKKVVTHKFDNGKNDVYQIRLRTGKKIEATLDHQFLTPTGWKQLRKLKKGEFLATPKKLFVGKQTFNASKLKLLSYLLADGALSNKSDCYFVNKNFVLLNDFKKSAESSFKNLKITLTKHIRNVYRANPSKIARSNYHEPNALLKWLRELGLKAQCGGEKSNKKFVPPFVFELRKKYISIFLATFWDCDGGISPDSAYLTTISEKLAYGVQTLLLKLGINSHVYQVQKYKSRNNEIMQSYRVCVFDPWSFMRKVGKLMLTDKGRAIINQGSVSGCDEFVPRQIFFQKIINYLKNNRISQRTFCRVHKINRSNLFGKIGKNRNRLNLRMAKKVANVLNDDELKGISDKRDIRWEDIVSIDYAGRKHVYNIEIRGTNNFVVNNIISHNCVYQEQVMRIARDLAGFSLSEADVLRKAIGKKIKKLLMAQRDKFIDGCKKNEVQESTALKIWHWIEPFAQYSFNRSHAAAYALIAYQTAYLKARFPVEFMASVLTSEKADVERIGFLISECKKMGLDVLPPDINESLENFTVIPPNQIRFGLLAIKNVGHNVVEAIVKERKSTGPYHSVFDFVGRVNSKDLNKKSLESLIKAGAFDRLAERNQLLCNLEKLLEQARESQRTKENGQKGLFEGMGHSVNFRLLSAVAATKTEKLTWEKELLGLFVTSHPLENFQIVLEKRTTAISKAKNFLTSKNIVKIGGVISSIKKIITRTGRPMLFVNLEDQFDKIEVVVFPGTVERNPTAFQENKVVLVSGRIENRDGTAKVICENIEEILDTADKSLI